jgi:hypothetical protein
MAKYTSGRQKNLKVGLTSYSENLSSLEVIGAAVFTGESSGELVRISQIGTGPAFLVEDSVNPDVTPFVITKEGKVAIGVAAGGISTSYKLEVDGGDIRFVTGSQGDLIISHSNLVSNIRSAGTVQLGLGANGGDTIRINLDNNVGIGTTTPTSKLYVVGDGYFTGIITASSFGGNALSATYASTSGVATYATTSGVSTFSGYANTSGFSTFSGYANNAGLSTYATTSGVSTYSGVSGFSTFSGYANNAGLSTYATTSGFSTFSGYANNAGLSTYATTAGVATALQNARTFQITGDIIASPISFNGTGNVSLAATIQPNSVDLGTDTSGDYVANITGTSNQITVTSGTGESSTPTLSLPSNLVVPQDLTVTRDLQVNRNLNVTGNITIGGTSATIFSQSLHIFDPDIILGFRTDAFNNDVSNDNTANHGGVAIASTEGSPLVQLFIAGIETNPATYKKIMWFKSGTFAGLGTDAWLSNYAVGIGSTQFPTGTRLAAGNVQFTQNDLAVVRNINASGVVTATSFSGNASSATYATSSGIATYATNAGIATYATNAGIATYADRAGIATYATTAGIATYATTAGIATYATTAGIATYATTAGIATYATTAGIATYATSAGIATNATYAITAGIATYATTAGIATNATYATSAGIATYAISSGIATYATNAGIATYATSAGIATYATSAGISTYATNAGIATYATSAGISTYATNAGIATYAPNAGIATYAISSGIATYATSAGIATYATNAGIATYATSAGISTYATNAGIATYAPNAGIATYATSSGIATYATSSGIATYATNAGIATYAISSGIATSVIGGIGSITQLQVTGISTFTNGPVFIGSATSTGTASQTLQVTGSAYVSDNVGIGTTNPTSTLTVQGNGLIIGVLTATSFSGNASSATYATNAGIATYATNAGIATYATSSGIATYATAAGVSTNLKGGVAGNVPYQSATDTTTFVTNGTSGQVLLFNGSVPIWGNVSAASGSFGGISVQDEGVNVGTSNSITTLNFIGSNVNVTATSGANGIATVTIANNLVGTALSISGISTLGTVRISSGIITATSGIVTYYGDGSQLSGVSGGLTVTDDTSTNATRYILFDDVTSGTVTAANVSSTKLTFNPSTGNLVAGGTVTANSDKKLKTDIRTIENALDKVLSLRGVEFTRIDTGDNQIGVIAQEVEEIIPEVVYPKSAPDYETKSVAYANLVGLLIEAVKEQNQRIVELERKLEEK